MKPIAFALPLALAACGPSSEAPPDPSSSRTASTEPTVQASPMPDRAPAVPDGSRPLTPVGDLNGEYRVAGIDGAELGGDLGIAVSIDGPMLSYEPTCAGFVWNIAEEGGEFSFTRAPGYGPTRQPDGSVMVCAVAVPAEFDRLGRAIDVAQRAWRTPTNGVLLEGGGRSVLLFSQ